jgi:uncharacterized protein (DUF1810 family)
MKPRIFIGSSGEALDVCYAIQQELGRDFDVTVWNQDVFRLTRDALDSLLAALDSSDAGVFVLRQDDLTESRGQSNPTVRDNVIFELGMFIGRLGRDRTFMLSPDGSTIRLPSDLIGITTAPYDADRFYREPRAAVGPACTQIRQLIRSIQLRISPEPKFRARLDRAMRRMSKDLEYLLADYSATQDYADSSAEWPGAISVQLARTSVCVEVGRIQDCQSTDTRAVIALPANEYFDDECISDTNSSLGAFVQHHFKNRVADFVRQVNAELIDVPSQRVPRAERRIDDSYGIGETILLSKLQPDYRLILVSATTERTGVGLRDPYRLERFVTAQDPSYEAAVSELRTGRKVGHWMWFIFPQFRGLGRTSTAREFAISSLPEAQAYLRHPVLGPRLIRCAQTLTGIEGKSADEIFGSGERSFGRIAQDSSGAARAGR